MFEWDQAKAKGNHAKHGVRFADTFAAFEDPEALTLGQVVHGEERQVTIGMDAFGRLLVVVWTWRGEGIRIISARKATGTEIRDYEGEL